MIYAILILGLVLRLISINQSFWLDEATSVLVAGDMNFSQILSQFSPGDFHPPFYYLLLKIWTTTFGVSEIGARSLSIITGLATIFIVYLIGKTIKNKKLGLLGAALLATSGLHVYFSQEARMYVLASFFVAVATYFFVKIQKEGGVGDWVGFSLALLLSSMTHYLTLLIIPVFWTAAFLSNKNFSWWKKFFASHIILIIVGLSWLPTFIRQFGGGLEVQATSPLWWNILGRTTIKEILLVPTKFMLGRISIENNLLYGFTAGIVGIAFGYLFIRAKKTFAKTRLIWLWLIIPLAISGVIGLRIPVFSYFRLLFVLPAFYLLLAAGISTLNKKKAKIALCFVLMVNLLSSGAYLFNEKFHREDWKGLVKFVESESRDKNSITLFVADSQMEAYKYYSKDAKIAGPTGLSEGLDLIWLMRYVQPMFDPEDKLRQEVEEFGYQKTGEFDFNGVIVWRYEK